jgi:hypothetical protein
MKVVVHEDIRMDGDARLAGLLGQKPAQGLEIRRVDGDRAEVVTPLEDMVRETGKGQSGQASHEPIL